MPDSKTGRLLPDEVRYLSFEGGGGKGAAYLGVLITFLRPEFDIFKKGDDGLTYLSDSIEGIAGSSAGAMTATLLGAGVPLEELLAMVLDILPSKDPQLISYSKVYRDNSVLEAFMDFDLDQKKAIVPDIFGKSGYQERNSELWIDAVKAFLLTPFPPNPLLTELKTLLQIYLNTKNINSNQIINSLDRLVNDEGLLPGVVMYHHLNFLINKYNARVDLKNTFIGNYIPYERDNTQNLVYQPYKPPQKSVLSKPNGMTFEEIRKKYNRNIIITGTNISREQLTYFSPENTPNLSISAAARISSSIPIFFKPIKITADQVKDAGFSINEQNILIGTWSDGGIINNHPFHAFDVINNGFLTKYNEKGKLNPNLLPIVLGNSPNMYSQTDINAKPPIHGIYNQLKSVLLNIMTENSTEAQYRTIQERTITLKVPTEIGKFKLKTQVFAHDNRTIINVCNAAVIATLNYFGWEADKHPALNIDEMPVGPKMKSILLKFKEFITPVSQ